MKNIAKYRKRIAVFMSYVLILSSLLGVFQTKEIFAEENIKAESQYSEELSNEDLDYKGENREETLEKALNIKDEVVDKESKEELEKESEEAEDKESEEAEDKESEESQDIESEEAEDKESEESQEIESEEAEDKESEEAEDKESEEAKDIESEEALDKESKDTLEKEQEETSENPREIKATKVEDKETEVIDKAHNEALEKSAFKENNIATASEILEFEEELDEFHIKAFVKSNVIPKNINPEDVYIEFEKIEDGDLQGSKSLDEKSIASKSNIDEKEFTNEDIEGYKFLDGFKFMLCADGKRIDIDKDIKIEFTYTIPWNIDINAKEALLIAKPYENANEGIRRQLKIEPDNDSIPRSSIMAFRAANDDSIRMGKLINSKFKMAPGTIELSYLTSQNMLRDSGFINEADVEFKIKTDGIVNPHDLEDIKDSIIIYQDDEVYDYTGEMEIDSSEKSIRFKNLPYMDSEHIFKYTIGFNKDSEFSEKYEIHKFNSFNNLAYDIVHSENRENLSKIRNSVPNEGMSEDYPYFICYTKSTDDFRYFVDEYDKYLRLINDEDIEEYYGNHVPNIAIWRVKDKDGLKSLYNIETGKYAVCDTDDEFEDERYIYMKDGAVDNGDVQTFSYRYYRDPAVDDNGKGTLFVGDWNDNNTVKRSGSKLRMENANRSRIYFFRIDRAFNRTVEVDIVKKPKRKNCFTDFTVHLDYIEKGKSIKLMRNGIQYGDAVTAENSGEFQYVFKNIPCYDDDFKAYNYTVEVSDAENYIVKKPRVVSNKYENEIEENSYYVISGYDRKHKTPLYRLSADYKKIKAEDDYGFPDLNEIWKTGKRSNTTSDGKDGYIIKDIINGMTLSPDNDYCDICLGDGTPTEDWYGYEEELLWSYYGPDKLFYYNSEFYDHGNNFCEVLRIDRDKFYLDEDRCFRANKKTIENYLSNVEGSASTIYLTKAFREDGDNLYSFYKYTQEIVSKKNKNKKIDASLSYNKYIDYLGDGVINPDTNIKNADDIYRLYLDVAKKDEACDILFVIDNTSSMNEKDMSSEDGETLSRFEMLEKVLKNGVEGDNGLINGFLDKNPENKIAITTFSGGYKQNRNDTIYKDVKDKYNHIVLDWTGSDGFNENDIDIREERHIGTNYISAYIRACEMFNKEAVKNDGHKKIMIFISDGQPNTVLARDKSGKFSEESIIKCLGNNKTTIQYTSEAIYEIRKELPSDLITYSMGIGRGTESAKTILSDIAENPQRYYYIKNYAEFKKAIRDLIRSTLYRLIEIEDRLSEYVNLLLDKVDLKITLDIKDDGEERNYIVWAGDLHNGNMGESVNVELSERDIQIMKQVFKDISLEDLKGSDLIESVSYENESDEIIRVKFADNIRVNKNIGFTVSYNVKTDEKAVSEYEKNGYSNVGDDNTDYINNTTSSGKAGFNSNLAAFITGKIYKEEIKHNYPHPVIQVKINEKPVTPSEPEKPATPSEPEKPATPSEPEKPAIPSEPDKPSHNHGGGGGGGGSHRPPIPFKKTDVVVENNAIPENNPNINVTPNNQIVTEKKISVRTFDDSRIFIFFSIIVLAGFALYEIIRRKLKKQ